MHIPAAAVGMIVVAVLCFAVLDAIVKHLATRYPVPILVWARYGVQAVATLLWLGPTMKSALLRTNHPGIHLARGCILLMSSFLFVNALRLMPLANATAINYLTPTIVVVLALIFLHERLTRPRIAFIVAGMVGMAFIVRPGTLPFQGGSLFALGAAASYSAFQILTRKLAGEDSRVLLFYPAFVGTLILTCALPWLERPAAVAWEDAALLLVGGLLGTAGHFLFILAFQRAPASGLTPFTYVQLVWATLVGWIAFGHFPVASTLIGMAIITVSGLLLTWHERRKALAYIHDPAAVD